MRRYWVLSWSVCDTDIVYALLLVPIVYVVPELIATEVEVAGDAAEGTIAIASWTRLADTPGNQAFVENYRLIKEVKLIKKELLRFTLYAIIVYLTVGALNPAVAASHPLGGNGTHFCGVIDCQLNKRHSDQFPNRNYARTFAANLNIGEPRTVRMIYFLPNDRPYRADEIQWMKDEIHKVQTFYADQMEVHGYGKRTFRVETDSHGEPIVHRVDGRRSNSHYVTNTYSAIEEIERVFDLNANVYHIILDAEDFRGHGRWGGKNAGYSLLPGRYGWNTVGHELGHAFGLLHDFSNGRYIMSYGPGMDRLSACHAEFLSVHPYFNPDIPLEEALPPTIELISPRGYPAGAERVPIRLKVRDSEGLHQVFLFVNTVEIHSAGGHLEVKACRGFEGEKEGVVEFDYDGVIPSDDRTSLSSALTHRIHVAVVDTEGNVSYATFVLFSEALERVSKISGDNQHGLPNTELPVPFVVQVRDLNDGSVRHGVPVTFTVTAGGGTLNIGQTETDYSGRAGSRLILGPNLGVNTVEVSAAGMTVIFNAVAGTAVDIPDPHLRAAIETKLRVASDTPISPADMVSLNTLVMREGNIHNLTGLEHATNIATLFLGGNNISDISPLAGLTNLRDLELAGNAIVDISPVAGLTSLTLLHFAGSRIADISPVAGLKRLEYLHLGGNNISDLSVLVDLTNLTWLGLWDNDISDLSPLASLTNLTYLYLVDNNISDLSPLVVHTGLGNGDEVDVRGNPLNTASINTHIPALQNRGVRVEFDNVSVEVVEPVNIPNPHLRAAIEKAHGKVSGDTITTVDMAILPRLDAPNADINDLTGLEHATNLTGLFLQRNNISDISAVAGLTNLTDLRLRYNAITDISPVARLTNLTDLTLDHNSITDISPVAGLTNLTWLGLSNNAITDISAVAGLTNLRRLALVENNISDISAVAKLTNLTGLWLWDNSISDLSPLIANRGLGEGDEVYVQSNPLSYQSIYTHIPTLQSRGVTVEFDNQAHPALLKISGDNQNGASFVSLSQPFVIEAQDANGSALTGVSVTFAVTTGGGTLSTTTTRTGPNGRAQSRLILGPNLGRNTVEVSAAGIESTATFYAIADSELSPTIADVNNDGSVNVLDLILIASSLGQSGRNHADINGDRVVTVLDLVLAAGMFEEAAAAPSAHPQVPETLTVVEVQGWLTDARSLEIRDPIMKRGIIMLEQLLVSLTPKETELLANYPNPFNPETWIPYRLAEDAFVTLTIYDQTGHVVRRLDVGHRIASAYESRSKAIYWDGRNGVGERVASGVYFYTLMAGDFSATRRMLILK